MNVYTLYVDESGHAGINYLDTRQPFHVAAAVLVCADNSATARTIITGHAPPNKELRGSKLLQSGPGRRTATTLLRELIDVGVVPFYIVMDRRFAISGKIVDVFLDPFHQEAVAWLPTSALKERKRIAELLADLLETSVLEAFAIAYRAPTSDAFAQILESVIRQLKENSHARLVTSFKGALNAVNVITSAETYGDAVGKHGDWAALNLPALFHLVRLVDRFADGRGRFAIIHDENEQFRKLFQHMIDQYNRPNSQTADLALPDGTSFRGVFRNLSGFEMGKSDIEPLLQAADLLAATIARVARAATTPQERPQPDIRRLAGLTMPALFYEDDDSTPHLAAAYAHDRTIAALIRLGRPSD